MLLPIPASQDERQRALAGAWVPPAGRLVVRIKDTLPGLWQGEADGFPPFVVGAPDTESRIYRFLAAFEPAEVDDESLATWSRLLNAYGQGGAEEDLRGEDFTELYRSALTCTRGDRVDEGIVLRYEAGMVRLCNELRRRLLA